jgi:outer membrane protein assembly factor BamA
LKLNALIFFCFFSTVITAQFRIDTSRRVNFLAIPVLFKTPETGWAYGLSASANFKTTHKNDSLTRTSVITAMGIFSQRQQNVQGLDATIYFPKEKYILYFNSSHSYFPDNFWGIGTYSKNEDKERYVFEQVLINPHIKKKFFKNTFFGVLADYQNVFRLQYINGGVMDNSIFFGKSNYNITGIGLSASYDTRNLTYWPTRGIFLQTQFTSYNNSIASSFSFNKWIIEARFFKQIFKGHILAAQLFNYSTFGDVPYRSLATFGGSGGMRGFYQGRFRDNSMYSVICEYRAHVFWRISACAFGGFGDVYNSTQNFNTNTVKTSFGGGLRLSILEKDGLNLRVDYGYSDKYNNGFYFTIGECF